MTLKEMLEKLEKKEITAEQFTDWHNSIVAKQVMKAKSKNVDPELEKKLERIQELEETVKSMSDGSIAKSKMDEVIKTLQAEYDKQITDKDLELERKMKSVNELESKLTNKTLREIGLKTAKELGISKAEYCIDDLIRDGKLKMSKVDNGNGEYSYEAEFDYEYNDTELNKRVKSNFKGSDSNIEDLKKGLTILMTGDTDYNRVKELYPIEKNIGSGSGVKGVGGIEQPKSREDAFKEMFKN